MCEPDRTRIVGPVRVLERFQKESDATRGLATCDRQPPMQPPEIRQTGRIDAFSRFGKTAERIRRLPEVVLKQPRLRQRTAYLDLIITTQSGLPERPDEQGRGLRTVALSKDLNCLGIKIVRHARSIPRIQAVG